MRVSRYLRAAGCSTQAWLALSHLDNARTRVWVRLTTVLRQQNQRSNTCGVQHAAFQRARLVRQWRLRFWRARSARFFFMLTFVTFLLVWLSYVGAYLFLIGAVFLGRALSVFLMPRVPHMRAKRGASGKRVFSGLQLQRLSLRNSQSTVRLPFQVLASVAFLGRGGLLTTTTAGQRVVLPLQPSLFMGSTTLTSSQLWTQGRRTPVLASQLMLRSAANGRHLFWWANNHQLLASLGSTQLSVSQRELCLGLAVAPEAFVAQLHTGVSKQRTGFMPTVGHSSFSLLPAVSVTLRAETRLRCVQGHVTTLLSRRTLGGFSGGSAATVSRKRRFSRTVRAYFSWVAYRPTNPSARLLRNTTLAFGPQHPAAHGILKIVLQLQGELVRHVDPQFGFLHRGTEKLMENRNFLQSLPYFDRFDYVANLTQEHAFCVALEALHPTVALTATTQLARALFDEVSRVLNHLLTLSATALDMSAMGPIFWAFEERENLMALLEQASGARMHTGLHRPFTFDVSVFTGVFFRDLSFFLSRCGRSISGAFLGLLNNRALRSRLSLVGQMTESKVLAYGLSGIPARSAGVLADRRLQTRMAATAYAYLNTRVFLGRRGDNLDRFVLRIKEAVEAFRALAQLQRLLSRPENPRLGVSQLTHTLGSSLRHCLRTRRTTTRLCRIVRGAAARTAAYGATLRPVSLPNFSFASSPTRSKFTSMEALISHFRLASEGWATPAGWAYRSVESPKGEVGVTLVANGSSRPHRAKLRTPVSHNMHMIPVLSRGLLFADFVATFCSLDIVLGEIDR